jgi:hypothetical protein
VMERSGLKISVTNIRMNRRIANTVLVLVS